MDARKIDVVTTCKQDHMRMYGDRMIDSFLRYWAPSTDLHFVGDFAPDQSVIHHAWPKWFPAWVDMHRDNLDAHGREPSNNRAKCKEYDFRRDCVRFAHKVAALTHVAQMIKTDVLIWMDADIITHRKVSRDDILSWLPDPHYIAWFDRVRMYPECGFMVFRADHHNHLLVMDVLADVYWSGKVFDLEQTHDSFVIENTILRMFAGGYIDRPFNLSGKSTSADPFNDSALSKLMTHLKGRRKYENR